MPVPPSEQIRRKLQGRFNRLLELTAGEKDKVLRSLSEAERRQMEKTLAAYEKLSPGQRQQCLRSFTQFATMSPAERQEFLKNAERWKKDPKAGEAKVLESWVKDYGGDSGKLMIHDPVGCEACGSSGYKGRVGLHELLVGTDALKKNIQEHARVAEMVGTALEDGMHTLKQDGIEKVLMGITDMKQVRAVCIK